MFVSNHSVIVYQTKDFQRWERIGVALGPRNRPHGIEFRPHVIYNEATKRFVMWYEDRAHAITSSGYFVATSKTPEGPFATVQENVTVADTPGDFDILVDDDGTAWHVQTTTNDPKASNGFAVTKLDATYTLPADPLESSHFVAPKPAEGPVFFKRRGIYYILGGTTCCACRGGSSIYVFRSTSPLGPWHFTGDVGANTTGLSPFDPHDPLAYVTHAQASTVISIHDQFLWLGNQWVTGSTRNSDLLYWSVLNFDDKGYIQQIKRSETATIIVPSSALVPARQRVPAIELRSQLGRPAVFMPAMALGTGGYDNSTVKQAVLDAHAAGFRAVHTAFDYFNAPGIARALEQLNRNEVFIIAMTSPCMHSASPPIRNVSSPEACTALTAREINTTITALGIQSVDLLLLHGPSEPFNFTGKCSQHVNSLNQAQWKAY